MPIRGVPEPLMKLLSMFALEIEKLIFAVITFITLKLQK